MQLEWRDVVGYEGLYEVSNDGRVRTVGHVTNNHEIPPKELGVRTYKNQRYARVRLYKNGVPKDYMVHRLVAQAFVPNPDNKPQVNHLDGDRSNNSAENLEWCTASENQRHAYETGLKNIEDTAVFTRKRVLQIGQDGEIVRVWRSMSDAARSLGLQVSNISHCCRGKIKMTGGYQWEYDSER